MPITCPQSLYFKVSKEITGKWQNRKTQYNSYEDYFQAFRGFSKKSYPETKSEIQDKQKRLYVSWALFLKLQAAGNNFGKLKTLISIHFSLLQFRPSVASVVSVMLFEPSFKVLSGYFYVSLNLTLAFCNFLIWLNFVTQLL